MASAIAAFLVFGATDARAQGCVSGGGGATSLACGIGATATALDSTAVGDSADATGANSTALGADAEATANQATAVGDSAEATGLNSKALGQNTLASATHTTAVGEDATAIALQATAVGGDSFAGGTDATALGFDATAAFAGSTALGASATTTRIDQVMVGTASNTYTMPGLTSAASTAAQAGATELVTTDATGNLATDGGATLAAIGTNTTDIAALSSSSAAISRAINENTEGIAMAMAMENPDLVGGESFGFMVNVGEFSGESAVAFSAMGVVARNVFGPNNGRLSVGAAIGFSDRETAGRVGLQLTF